MDGGGEVKEPVKQGMKVALLVPVGKIIRSAKICANVKRQYFISFGVPLFAPPTMPLRYILHEKLIRDVKPWLLSKR